MSSHSADPRPPTSARCRRAVDRPARPGRARRSGASIDRSGRVIGHLQALARGCRTSATGRDASTRRVAAFRDLGEFWSADDAVDCLRLRALTLERLRPPIRAAPTIDDRRPAAHARPRFGEDPDRARRARPAAP